MMKEIVSKSTFRIFKIELNEIIFYEINSTCRCDIEYVCLKHHEANANLQKYHTMQIQTILIDKKMKCECSKNTKCLLHWNEQKNRMKKEKDENSIERLHVNNTVLSTNVAIDNFTSTSFSTQRRFIRRIIDESQSLKFLKKWNKTQKIEIELDVSNSKRLKFLQLIWIYRDVIVIDIVEVFVTDLIIHRVHSRQDLKSYVARQSRLINDKKWKFREFIQKNIDASMYEKTVTTNDRTFQFNSLFKLTSKKSEKNHLMFNYHYIYENSQENTMKLFRKVQEMISNSKWKMYFEIDMKHDYWEVTIHSENHHYSIFHISKLNQLQFTRMSQETRTSSFTFTKLMNILLKFISSSNSKSSLLHNVNESNSNVEFYIDDIFEEFVLWQELYDFLKQQFFSRLIWNKMKIFFQKLRIEILKIKCLKQMFNIEKSLNIKQKSIDKIRNWSVSQDKTKMRNFMKIINITRKWILNFDEITRSFQRLQSKTVEWKWTEFENLTFLTLKKLATNVVNMFDHDFNFSIETFTNASKWIIEIYIRQLQNDEIKFILFDSYSFTSTQRNYDTYKKKLFAIVHFIEKHEHYFNVKNISTINTNHKCYG